MDSITRWERSENGMEPNAARSWSPRGLRRAEIARQSTDFMLATSDRRARFEVGAAHDIEPSWTRAMVLPSFIGARERCREWRTRWSLLSASDPAHPVQRPSPPGVTRFLVLPADGSVCAGDLPLAPVPRLRPPTAPIGNQIARERRRQQTASHPLETTTRHPARAAAARGPAADCQIRRDVRPCRDGPWGFVPKMTQDWVIVVPARISSGRL
jgi:hypothetical protein